MRFLQNAALVLWLTVSLLAGAQERTDVVSIVGAVRSPGRFTVKEPIRLQDAIGLAGGFTAYANRHAIEVTHNGMTSTIDIDPILTGKAAPVLIEGGDTVRVP